MKLVLEELRDNITQQFFADARINIIAIEAWIYKHLSPAGAFKMVVEQNGLILGSQEFTSADIEADTDSEPGNYWHGNYKIIFDKPFSINEGLFDIRLEHTGYSFQESAYLAWVKPHENKYVDESHSPVSDIYNSLGFTLWGYQAGENMSRVLNITDGFSSNSNPTVSSFVNQVGSQGSPVLVDETGYQDDINTDQVIFIAGDGEAKTVTANPQIGTAETGTRIYLKGTSDTDTVTFQDGNGLKLNGAKELANGSVLELIKTDSEWLEVSFNE